MIKKIVIIIISAIFIGINAEHPWGICEDSVGCNQKSCALESDYNSSKNGFDPEWKEKCSRISRGGKTIDTCNDDTSEPKLAI